MQHFSAIEFGKWWPFMSENLLVKLDELREAWGAPIIISPAIGSLGRIMGSDAESQHNVDRWGEVRAADIMPQIKSMGGVRSLDPFECEMFFNMAKDVGFTGIGVYPSWKPFAGFHVDVRETHVSGSPATWAGIKTASGQEYVGVEQAFA